MELVLVLSAFLSCFLDHSSAIWCESIDNTSAVQGDGVKSLVGTSDHHFVDYDFLCSQNDSVLAVNTQNSAKEIKMSQIWMNFDHLP